jgi:hypothetical protein
MKLILSDGVFLTYAAAVHWAWSPREGFRWCPRAGGWPRCVCWSGAADAPFSSRKAGAVPSRRQASRAALVRKALIASLYVCVAGVGLASSASPTGVPLKKWTRLA